MSSALPIQRTHDTPGRAAGGRPCHGRRPNALARGTCGSTPSSPTTSRHLHAVDAVLLPPARKQCSDGGVLVHDYLRSVKDLEVVLAHVKAHEYGSVYETPYGWPGVWSDVDLAMCDHRRHEEVLGDRLTDTLDDPRLDLLARRLCDAELAAPSRPHPYTPHTGLLGLVARKVMHTVDTFWDTAEGRMVPEPAESRRSRRAGSRSTSWPTPASTWKRTRRSRSRAADPKVRRSEDAAAPIVPVLRRQLGDQPAEEGVLAAGLHVDPAGAGQTGRAVCAALTERGATAVPLGRADWPGLARAMADCDAAYLVAPNLHPDEPAYVAAALDAMRVAGVHRLGYHSVASPYAPEMPHHVGKARAEDLVRRSGLAWTILQPGVYLQNYDLSGPVRMSYDVAAPIGFLDLAAEAGVPAERVDGWPGDGLDGRERAWLQAMFEYYDRHGLPVGTLPLRALLDRLPDS